MVKNEFVDINGRSEVVSVLGVNTLHVAQHPSNFSNLKTEDVVVSAGSLLIGISSGVLPVAHVYKTIGLVLKLVEEFCPKNPLSQVSRQLSLQHTLC